jgi:aminoglycoside 3-N-acetyltransferase
VVYSLLPDVLRARLHAAWSSSALRRRLRQRRAAARRTLKVELLAHHGAFNAAELGDVLRQYGVARGDVVFLQCSFNDLHTLQATPLQLIDALQSLVGDEGTLMMPAYTLPPSAKDAPFDPVRAATYAGIVCELFRRSPGVMRSLHPRHSICARGPLAQVLLTGHETCVRADGPDSPFDRLRLLPQAKIVTLGLPLGHVSFLHWVEDLEPGRLPFPVHLGAAVPVSLRMPDGEVRQVLDLQLRPDIPSRLALDRLFRRVSKDSYTYGSHKGVAIGVYSMSLLAGQLLMLRDRGCIHYW